MKTRWLRIAAYNIKRSSYGRKKTQKVEGKNMNTVEGNDSGQFEASRVFDILQKLLQIRLHPGAMICSTLLIFHWQETWNVVSVCVTPTHVSPTLQSFFPTALMNLPPHFKQELFPYSDEKKCFNCFRISMRINLVIDNKCDTCARFVRERRNPAANKQAEVLHRG